MGKESRSAVFNDVPTQFDFAANDAKIREFWKAQRVFKRSEELNKKSGETYVFYDGPPGTNGKPHIGHIMQSALKDLWPRFETMRGKQCLRKAGWDTHGLPVELTAEAELGLSGKVDIERYGIAAFVNHCRETVLRFRADWVTAIEKLGRFLDFDDDYLTMSNDFIQSDWWVMQQAFNAGLIYSDYKIVPYCCRCGTGLSSHEVAQGYRDITDLTLTAIFEIEGESNLGIVAWTTTPWTLLGNVALAVGPEIDYVQVKAKTGKFQGREIILAQARLENYKAALEDDPEIIKVVRGSELVGLKYKPLWNFFPDAPAAQRRYEIIADEYVTTDTGTGVVHLALYGEDDFRLIKKYGFPQIQHVGADGNFVTACGPYAGRMFRAEGLDVEIVQDLAARNSLFDKFRYEHSYPHCWRCKTALMYFAKSSWFLKTTAIKDKMMAANQAINWQPPHIKDGRFGNWLENNVDWAISRERYWGSPINIWTKQGDPSKRICIASIAELQQRGAFFESSGEPVPADFDLHIPIIDDVVIRDKDGEIYRRERGVLDCWFNAGVMPWGQYGYPAKPGSKEHFQGQFPADFICEAIDQTRGWFYTLLAVSTAITGGSSFKNVICTELILDKNGKKMSKSIGNVVDPVPLVEKYGADAVRWTFYDSDPWQVKRFAADSPAESLRSVLIPIWNCYSFFTTYANLDRWQPVAEVVAARPELDRWILSELSELVVEVTKALENYDVAPAARAISSFVDSLTNWYIRRARKRFWKSEDDGDKHCAYATLYEALVTLSKVIAPFAPFMAETIYQNLVRSIDSAAPDSVHLCKWPESRSERFDQRLVHEMSIAREIASLARSLRTEHNLKVRQPLAECLVAIPKERDTSWVKRYIEDISEEINVKKIEVVADAASLIDLGAKPNWRALGPRFGAQMKQVAAVLEKLNHVQIAALAAGNSIELDVAGEKVSFTSEDVTITQTARPGMVARAGKHCSVALTTTITPELMIEGLARELQSLIQRRRKEQDFAISDKIEAKVWGDEDVKKALQQHGGEISRECLARALHYSGATAADKTETFELNGKNVALELRVVN